MVSMGKMTSLSSELQKMTNTSFIIMSRKMKENLYYVAQRWHWFESSAPVCVFENEWKRVTHANDVQRKNDDKNQHAGHWETTQETIKVVIWPSPEPSEPQPDSISMNAPQSQKCTDTCVDEDSRSIGGGGDPVKCINFKDSSTPRKLWRRVHGMSQDCL